MKKPYEENDSIDKLDSTQKIALHFDDEMKLKECIKMHSHCIAYNRLSIWIFSCTLLVFFLFFFATHHFLIPLPSLSKQIIAQIVENNNSNNNKRMKLYHLSNGRITTKYDTHTLKKKSTSSNFIGSLWQITNNL